MLSLITNPSSNNLFSKPEFKFTYFELRKAILFQDELIEIGKRLFQKNGKGKFFPRLLSLGHKSRENKSRHFLLSPTRSYRLRDIIGDKVGETAKRSFTSLKFFREKKCSSKIVLKRRDKFGPSPLGLKFYLA